jgi:hypothetical protein
LAANKERASVFVSDKSKYAQEMMGAMSANEACVIQDADIEALQNRRLEPLIDLVSSETTVWTYIDPNGGARDRGKHGPPSKLGMCSIIRHGKKRIIVALHSQQAVGEKQTLDQVSHYFGAMAADPFLASCRHILFVEGNYGGCLTADYFHNRARRQIPTIQMVNWFSDYPGVRKTRENTSSGVMSFIVDMVEGNISFYTHMCSASDDARQESVNDFLGQCTRLHKVLHPDGKYSYSAKTETECDDALVAYFMAVYFSYHFLLMQHYEQLDKGLHAMRTSYER